MQDIWTNKYRPSLPDDLPGSRLSVATIKSLASSGSLPHMIFHGPENSGKTTAALALAESLYGEDKDLNYTYLNASDFFEQGKAYLSKDKRFRRFIGDDPSRINRSVISVFKDILNEYAALAPMNASFKIIYIDDADALTDDAQNALRRIMEKYSGTCRFIFAVRNQASLIPPLRSRCIVLFFSYLCDEDLASLIRNTAAAENIDISDEAVEKIVRTSGGCIPTAFEILQLSAADAGAGDRTGMTVVTGEMIDDERCASDPLITEFADAVLEKRNIRNARTVLDKLLFDVGMTGREILIQTADVIRHSGFPEEKKARLALLIAGADSRMTDASNERIVLESFIAQAADLV